MQEIEIMQEDFYGELEQVNGAVVNRLNRELKHVYDRLELKDKMIEDGTLSDGYHTFNELYEFRLLYNACLFNEWFSQKKYDVHKSKKHYEGDNCFGGGWFVVVAILPTGQISNHYNLKYWDYFRCEELKTAKYPFDGYTSKDVVKRLTHEAKYSLENRDHGKV
jgi:hypothetical protein